jgi:predicted glycoside hydrolase/deacetylase ChbG (UPF0249 family)
MCAMTSRAARLVILNADDFGYDSAISEGIAEAIQHGIVSSTTMMVNSPSVERDAPLARSLQVGLHLNLVRFSAVSDPSHVLDEAKLSALTAAFVEQETTAQLDRFARLLGRAPTHLDVHKHAHLVPAVLEGIAAAARAARLPVRSITADMRRFLRQRGVSTNDVFLGDAGANAFWTLRELEAQLDDLPSEGIVELMCHPGHAPTRLRSTYSAQREVELSTFVSSEARALLTRKQLVLSSWAEVPRSE